MMLMAPPPLVVVVGVVVALFVLNTELRILTVAVEPFTATAPP